MHPDRKIGIAMGILLVGVVAALFFRNEPLAVDGGLSVERENEINQRLRDRDVTVFLDDQLPTDVSKDSHEPNWSLPVESLTSLEDEMPIPIGGRGLPLQPQNAQPAVTEVTPKPPVDAERPTEPEEVLENAVSVVADAPSPPQDFIEYTVKFGDTLSEISQKFLGSQARFREIYDANKDRMDSPDRLRVGKAIRIPRIIR